MTPTAPLDCSDPTASFPTTASLQRCVGGDMGACVQSAGFVVVRAGILATGFAIAGQRERLVQDGLIGSLAVQAGLLATVSATGRSWTPSAEAVVNGGPLTIAATYLARSALIGGALWLAGSRTNVWRRAFTGAALIEAGVLSWGAQQRLACQRVIQRTDGSRSRHRVGQRIESQTTQQ